MSDPDRYGQMTKVITGEASLHLRACNSSYGYRELFEMVHHDAEGHYETVHHDAEGHYE